MSKTKPSKRAEPRRERALFTLPPDLLAEARRYAGAFHQGNNSGFVAAAIRSYIGQLNKSRHTAKLRESYAASSPAAAKLASEWDAAADEAWQRLDAKRSRGRA